MYNSSMFWLLCFWFPKYSHCPALFVARFPSSLARHKMEREQRAILVVIIIRICKTIFTACRPNERPRHICSSDCHICILLSCRSLSSHDKPDVFQGVSFDALLRIKLWIVLVASASHGTPQPHHMLCAVLHIRHPSRLANLRAVDRTPPPPCSRRPPPYSCPPGSACQCCHSKA